MISLADALAAAKPSKPGPMCTVAKVVAVLPQADADLLVAALADRAIPNEKLFNACREAGIDLTLSPIARHRRQGCDCPRPA